MNVYNSKSIHTVQVRELVGFVLRQGDLGGDSQFVGTDRALAGIRGHQKIQRARPAGYQTEIPVERLVDAGDFRLHIRGRIDGLLARPDEVLLEEIKTVHGIWNHEADPLHWAQAKFYGYMYAQEHGWDQLIIQLTYLELASGRTTELRQDFSFGELADFFNATTAVYLGWLREEQQWGRERNQSIAALTFPFPAYRPGQRELAVAAYRTLAQGGRLFLAAATGIGKTISVLFPAAKALGAGKIERIFYLTARTVGRTIAEKALADLRQGGLKLRSITLTAREKVCVRNGQPCEMPSCPLAIGYYDRVKPAIRETLAQAEITAFTLKLMAEKHQVCPFELSLDVSVWADVVICDYNYVFDPQVYLRRHFAEGGGEYAFLVDEAHNLVDRARDMFSAELDAQQIRAVQSALKPVAPRCARALGKLNSGMRKLARSGVFESTETSDPAGELNLFPTQANPIQAGQGVASTSRQLPEGLVEWVEAALAEAETWLARNEPAGFRADLLTLYFRLNSFRRTIGIYDENFVTLVKKDPSVTVRLFCLNPATPLRQALERGKAAIFFSATLTPVDYYRLLLGGAPEDRVLQLASPFPSENLAVLIQDKIPTHFKGRAKSLGQVVEAIGTLVQGRRGNYLVYFPSYQYLKNVLQEFQMIHPFLTILVQRPDMTELERADFLAAFSHKHDQTLVGFVVLGGIFGEGIDLTGEHLIGAAIVGVGLPQLCVERDLIRDYFQQQNAAGFDYAYTFPGMNRVLQAIGRVIRSETDRGVVLLIDTRFHEPRYRRLFPSWWRSVWVHDSNRLKKLIREFWAQ